jgi:hypothetical protein
MISTNTAPMIDNTKRQPAMPSCCPMRPPKYSSQHAQGDGRQAPAKISRTRKKQTGNQTGKEAKYQPINDVHRTVLHYKLGAFCRYKNLPVIENSGLAAGFKCKRDAFPGQSTRSAVSGLSHKSGLDLEERDKPRVYCMFCFHGGVRFVDSPRFKQVEE